jgi:hypothetical protein
MMADWAELRTELARWMDAGRTATFWWRDDDATAPGPRLERLAVLSGTHGIPVGLAVIPGRAREDLGAALGAVPLLKMLVHGHHHHNNAPAGEKKAEFGAHRPLPEMLGDAAVGRETLVARFPDLALPVFVPPWNRIDPTLVERLSSAHFKGLSRYGQRGNHPPAENMVENNCHLDLINWRGGRNFIGRGEALEQLIDHLSDRRTGRADRGESTGVLSHHAVMDEESWVFLAELFARATESDGAHWLTIDEVFRVPE